MKTTTMQHLKMLEAQHPRRQPSAASRLKVYYGFSKLNKIQKREAIQVSFENEQGAGSDGSRSGKTLRKLMNIVTERYQTTEEASDAAYHNRMFTTYLIFLDDKKIGGSLEKALAVNMAADHNHVGQKMLKEIADKLRVSYMASHPGYKEPTKQLEIQFAI